MSKSLVSRSVFALVVGIALAASQGCGSKPESTTVISQPVQTPEEAAAAAKAYEESMK